MILSVRHFTIEFIKDLQHYSDILPQYAAGEGVTLEAEDAALLVEREIVELHGTGGRHAQPHLVDYQAAEVDLDNQELMISVQTVLSLHPGGLLRLRGRVGGGGDGVGDDCVRDPEVLQSVLQAVPLEGHQALLSREMPEPAPRVSPGLGQVQVQADLHPRQVDAGDGDQSDVDLNLHFLLLSLPVLG